MALFTPIKEHAYFPFVHQYMSNFIEMARGRGYVLNRICKINKLQVSKAYTLRSGKYSAPVSLWILNRYANAIGSDFMEVMSYHEKDIRIENEWLKERVKELELQLSSTGSTGV